MKRKAVKQAEAIERQEVAAKRSAMEQLVRLDKKLGVGKGAKKERARLAKQIGNLNPLGSQLYAAFVRLKS